MFRSSIETSRETSAVPQTCDALSWGVRAFSGLIQSATSPFRFDQSVSGNYSLESRVRENRTHGSVAGESGSTGLPYPYRLST